MVTAVQYSKSKNMTKKLYSAMYVGEKDLQDISLKYMSKVQNYAFEIAYFICIIGQFLVPVFGTIWGHYIFQKWPPLIIIFQPNFM